MTATNGSRALPREVRLLVLTMGLGGGAVVVWRLVQAASWGARDLGAWALLAAGIAVAELVPVRLSFRTERIAFSVTEAVWVAGLMAARPSVIGLAVAAGVFAGHGARRKPLPKLVFNTGQFVLSVSAAQAVYGLFHPSARPSATGWLASVAGVAVYAVVNSGSVAAVVAGIEQLPFRSVLLPPLGANALHYLGNASIGLAGATMWSTSAFAIPVVGVLLVLAFVTYRTVLDTVQRTRLVALRVQVRTPERAWRPATIS